MHENNFTCKFEKVVSANQNSVAHVSCHSSSQNVSACDLHCIFIAQLREREIFKIGLLYTEREKCSCKPLLKEKIPDPMQAFTLDTESH